MKIIPLLVLLMVLAGCVSTPPVPAEQIVGKWRSDVGGFDIITTYTVDEVMINGFEPRKYVLNDDELVIEGDEISARTVSFPSSNEMVQVDGITATSHRYTRIDG